MNLTTNILNNTIINSTITNHTCVFWRLHSTLQSTSYTIRSHSELDFFIPLIALPTGLLLAFMGFRLVKPSLMIISGVFGVLLFLHAASTRKDLVPCEAVGIGALVMGLIFAFVSRAVLQMAFFLAGAFSGGAMTHYVFVLFPELEETYSKGGIIFEHSLIPYWLAVVLIGVVFGILTVKYEKAMIKGVTSAIGGFLVAAGINILYDDMYWISVVVGISITLAGLLVQWKEYNPCKRTGIKKKQTTETEMGV